MNDSLAAKVRSVIAEHFGIDAERLTDEARFRDFGADWLDRLELMIAIEDQVPGVEIADVLLTRSILSVISCASSRVSTTTGQARC